MSRYRWFDQIFTIKHSFLCHFKSVFYWSVGKNIWKVKAELRWDVFHYCEQVLENSRAKLCLQLHVDIESLNAESGHSCNLCGYLLDEQGAEIFDKLPELEEWLPTDIKMFSLYCRLYLSKMNLMIQNCILKNLVASPNE